MDCKVIQAIVIFLLAFVLINCTFTESYKPVMNVAKPTPHKKEFTQAYDPIPNNQLIGLIYPPRAGPLHTNIEFPVKHDECPKPFHAIYEQAPYMRSYNQLKNSCI